MSLQDASIHVVRWFILPILCPMLICFVLFCSTSLVLSVSSFVAYLFGLLIELFADLPVSLSLFYRSDTCSFPRSLCRCSSSSNVNEPQILSPFQMCLSIVQSLFVSNAMNIHFQCGVKLLVYVDSFLLSFLSSAILTCFALFVDEWSRRFCRADWYEWYTLNRFFSHALAFVFLVGSARNVIKSPSFYFNGRIRYGTKGEKVEERLLVNSTNVVYWPRSLPFSSVWMQSKSTSVQSSFLLKYVWSQDDERVTQPLI